MIDPLVQSRKYHPLFVFFRRTRHHGHELASSFIDGCTASTPGMALRPPNWPLHWERQSYGASPCGQRCDWQPDLRSRTTLSSRLIYPSHIPSRVRCSDFKPVLPKSVTASTIIAPFRISFHGLGGTIRRPTPLGVRYAIISISTYPCNESILSGKYIRHLRHCTYDRSILSA